MHQITPHALWVGHADDGRAPRKLMDQGIQAIVQLAMEERPPQLPRDLIFCRFPLLDGIGNDPVLLNLAINTVAALLESNVPTLVCCGGGMSRSPAIAAAALSLVENAPLERCLQRVAECYPADVLPGLWDEVCQAVAGGSGGKQK
jgi:hypothetical protein